jgi:two-component system CheB/CheR fusion protein
VLGLFSQEWGLILGIKSIKEQRGFVLVQEPTAKFDSMPLHATQAILVDIVAPVEELPAN